MFGAVSMAPVVIIGGSELLAGNAGITTLNLATRTPASRALEPSAGMIRAFSRQLADHGRGAVQRSIRRLEGRLTEHLKKLEEINARGGNPGSVEREIANFRRQIEAAKRVLEDIR